MNYNKITRYDTANGPGVRITLWVSGCTHHCKGCHNPDTWNKDKGNKFKLSDLNSILDFLSLPYIRGLSLSGGDPLHPNNREDILTIVSRVKSIYPNKDIWMWTGYSWEEISDLPIMDYIDVLIDGEFILEQRDITLPYCGSPNQRVIDVKKTIESGDVVLYYDNNSRSVLSSYV